MQHCEMTRRANRVLARRSKKHRYSITLSARASSVGGTSRPRVRAVCALIQRGQGSRVLGHETIGALLEPIIFRLLSAQPPFATAIRSSYGTPVAALSEAVGP
jgi:hypothetical protein